MLRVFSNSTLDSVNKGLGLTQALIKEVLEFFPGDEDDGLIFHFLLMLLPTKQDKVLEESDGKLHSILTLGPGGGKMVLTLLEEVIGLQVSFIPIHVRELGLQRLFTRAFILLRCKNRRKSRRSRIQNGPEDLLEIIFQVLYYKRQSRNDRRSNGVSRGTWHGRGVIALSGGITSEFVFATKRKILRKSVASGKSSH